MVIDSRVLLKLSLARIPFLKPREKLFLSGMLAEVEDLCRLGKADLEALLMRKLKISFFKPEEYVQKALEDGKYLTKRNILCTFYNDGGYPALLKEIYDPPLALFYQGLLPDERQPVIAVVGTRKPSGKALTAAFELGVDLARSGAWVVSGLAIGIDRAVQRGCVAGGGRTVAVVGNGIGSVYPPTSRKLAAEILETGGAIASEYPPGTLPLKHHFPARNRIISGLASAVVVIEAPEKSGSLITADYALDQGRDLFVHETGCRSAQGKGTRLLAEQGATQVRSAADILAEAMVSDTRSRLPEGLQKAEKKLSLADLLELELENKLFYRNGEPYWRGENGGKE